MTLRPRRRRTTWALAASTAAHLGVLGAVLLLRHSLGPVPDEVAGPSTAVIPVILAPRSAKAPARGTPPPRTTPPRHQARRSSDAEAAPIAPLVALPGPAPASPAAPGPDLQAALRHGAVGCANLGAAGMTRADRDGCRDQLARGAASAPFMPLALEPRMRAYYDAVALAKQRDPPHVAVINKVPIPGDPPPHRPGGDHLPAIACSIPFGGGVKPKKLPHAFYIGPCFIEPPKGPFDPEVDITPP